MKIIGIMIAAASMAWGIQASAQDVAPAPIDGVYCADKDTLRVFAARPVKDGLQFAVSLWYPNKANFALMGIARPFMGGWLYTEKADPKLENHCALDMVLSLDGSVILKTHKEADCRVYGGYGATLTSVVFKPETKEGPVRDELNSMENFMKRSCAHKN